MGTRPESRCVYGTATLWPDRDTNGRPAALDGAKSGLGIQRREHGVGRIDRCQSGRAKEPWIGAMAPVGGVVDRARPRTARHPDHPRDQRRLPAGRGRTARIGSRVRRVVRDHPWPPARREPARRACRRPGRQATGHRLARRAGAAVARRGDHGRHEPRGRRQGRVAARTGAVRVGREQLLPGSEGRHRPGDTQAVMRRT